MFIINKTLLGRLLGRRYVRRISELIFQKVATEFKHILRLSRLKEYASPENKTSIGSIVHRKKPN